MIKRQLFAILLSFSLICQVPVRTVCEDIQYMTVIETEESELDEAESESDEIVETEGIQADSEEEQKETEDEMIIPQEPTENVGETVEAEGMETEGIKTEEMETEQAEVDVPETEMDIVETELSELEKETEEPLVQEEAPFEEITESESTAETELDEAEDSEESETDFFDDDEPSEEELMAALEQVQMMAMDLEASGTPVVSSDGWMSTEYFSEDFRPLKFYPGISSMEYFCTSDQVVRAPAGEGREYLYPLKTGLGGTFGAVYHKVLFYDHRWYDVKMTVVDYSDHVMTPAGESVPSFPYIVMEQDQIGWKFNEGFGDIVLKCEIIDSENGALTPVNTRFQWWDIDGAQRFGIKAQDGAISGKYYYDGSRIHCQDGQTVAGTGGFSLVIGPAELSDYVDPKYCAVYELRDCSTYYIAFPEIDHIECQGYGYPATRIESNQKALANGQYVGVIVEAMLRQTDASLSRIEIPEPKKTVSPDGEEWFEEVELDQISNAYWYCLEQYVPWQDIDYFYSEFTIKDVLKKGVKYLGNLTVVRVEDGVDVTDEFVVSETNQTVQISARNEMLTSGAFYGYHYQIRFQAMMEKTELEPEIEEECAQYRVTNTGSIIFKGNDMAHYEELESNEVVTIANVRKKVPSVPEKRIDADMNCLEKSLWNRNEEIQFSIYQEIPENDELFCLDHLVISDELLECFEFQKAELSVKKKTGNSYEKVEAEVKEEGQNISGILPYTSAYNGAMVRMDLWCTIRKNADLKKYQTGNEIQGQSVLPNQAETSFYWKGTTDVTRLKTNEVKILYNECRIILEKEIDSEDLVAAHGNPIFTFVISGTDSKGHEQHYTRVMEFRAEEKENGGKLHQSVEISVLPGKYDVTELPVMRYELKEIRDVVSGTADGDHVCFSLEKGGEGKAVFCNEKIYDGYCSDTAYICNRIG